MHYNNYSVKLSWNARFFCLLVFVPIPIIVHMTIWVNVYIASPCHY